MRLPLRRPAGTLAPACLLGGLGAIGALGCAVGSAVVAVPVMVVQGTGHLLASVGDDALPREGDAHACELTTRVEVVSVAYIDVPERAAWKRGDPVTAYEPLAIITTRVHVKNTGAHGVRCRQQALTDLCIRDDDPATQAEPCQTRGWWGSHPFAGRPETITLGPGESATLAERKLERHVGGAQRIWLRAPYVVESMRGFAVHVRSEPTEVPLVPPSPRGP